MTYYNISEYLLALIIIFSFSIGFIDGILIMWWRRK
jgi:hypothetical protein